MMHYVPSQNKLDMIWGWATEIKVLEKELELITT